MMSRSQRPTGALNEVEDDSNQDQLLFLKQPIDVGALCEGGADLEFDFDRINLDGATLEEEVKVKEEKETETKERQYGQMSAAAFDAEDEADDSDLSPFDALRRKMTSLTSDGGVRKQVLQQGVGDVVPRGTTVFYHYSFFLELADEPFDCSRLQGNLNKVNLAKDENSQEWNVIRGLDIGLASMRKAEMARFLIAPDYAFGKLGAPPRIPANACIMAEVELINFMETGSAEEFLSMPFSERKEAPFEMCYQAVVAIRNKGNELFKQKRYEQASKKYQKAVRLLEEARLADEKDEMKMRKELVKNLVNCAVSYGKENNQWGRVITCCNRAIHEDQQCTKAYYFKGKALRKLDDLTRSRQALMEARRLKPDDPDISKELSALNDQMQNVKASERVLCERMFNFGPNTANTKPTQPNTTILSSSTTTPSDDIDSSFEDIFRQGLQDLLADESQADYVATSMQYTEKELGAMRRIAREMGMEVEERGEGTQYQVRVKKPANT